MNREQFNELTRDPVTDDPNFDFKNWVLNRVNPKPYWPLGSLPHSRCEATARLLQVKVGKWVPTKSLKAVRYWASLAINACRHRYGMVIEEKVLFGEIHYRWTGVFRGNVDDRIITEQMRQEERDLLAMQVKLQTENLELLQFFRQVQARFRKWSRKKERYHKRVRSFRRQISHLNPARKRQGCPQGVDEWPQGLCARWYRPRRHHNVFGRPRLRPGRAGWCPLRRQESSFLVLFRSFLPRF